MQADILLWYSRPMPEPQLESAKRMLVTASRSVQIHAMAFDEHPIRENADRLGDAIKTVQERYDEYRQRANSERMAGNRS